MLGRVVHISREHTLHNLVTMKNITKLICGTLIAAIGFTHISCKKEINYTKEKAVKTDTTGGNNGAHNNGSGVIGG